MAAMGGAGGGANAANAELKELEELWKEKAIPNPSDDDPTRSNKNQFRKTFAETLLKNEILQKLNETSFFHKSFEKDVQPQLPLILKTYLGVNIDETKYYIKDLSETINWLKILPKPQTQTEHFSGTAPPPPLFSEEEIATVRRVMKSILETQKGGRRHRRSKRNTRRRRTTRRRRNSHRR